MKAVKFRFVSHKELPLVVLPRCFCFCREVFGFAVTGVGHHKIGLSQSIFYYVLVDNN